MEGNSCYLPMSITQHQEQKLSFRCNNQASLFTFITHRSYLSYMNLSFILGVLFSLVTAGSAASLSWKAVSMSLMSCPTSFRVSKESS